jgi:hypothetical protein
MSIMAFMVERDLIDELALIAVPGPRHGEIEPPENFAAAYAESDRQRQDYTQALRKLVAETGEDPLLAALRTAAARRDVAERQVKALISYGRHCTGARPDYTWEALAAAAGLPYSTARKAITQADVDAMRAALDTPAQRWPTAVASLEVHRAYSELRAHGVDGVPEDLDPDTERTWWLDKADEVHDTDPSLSRRISWAAHHWHNRWLRVAHPRGTHYTDIGQRLREMGAAVYHWDPAQRDIPDEADELTAIIDQLTELRDQRRLGRRPRQGGAAETGTHD